MPIALRLFRQTNLVLFAATSLLQPVSIILIWSAEYRCDGRTPDELLYTALGLLAFAFVLMVQAIWKKPTIMFVDLARLGSIAFAFISIPAVVTWLPTLFKLAVPVMGTCDPYEFAEKGFWDDSFVQILVLPLALLTCVTGFLDAAIERSQQKRDPSRRGNP